MRTLKLTMIAILCAMLGTAAADPASAIYVMRHLNTPEGERDPDLTAAGTAAAGHLVDWFGGKPLTAIYVSDYRRSRQTAAPLAAEREIAVTVYDPRDTPALIARVRQETGPVLIVGHSNTVPDFVEQLGGTRPGPMVHADFGDIWTIRPGETLRERIVPGS